MARFDDGKDESALRTIGEVSDGLGIKPHVLRYWEQQFSLLKPLKRGGGRRYYRTADIAMVEEIDRLVNSEGYTLKGAEAVLKNHIADGNLNRRENDRRIGDRRTIELMRDDSPAASSSHIKVTEQVLTPAVEDAVAKLKDIRKRLARAIEV